MNGRSWSELSSPQCSVLHKYFPSQIISFSCPAPRRDSRTKYANSNIAFSPLCLPLVTKQPWENQGTLSLVSTILWDFALCYWGDTDSCLHVRMQDDDVVEQRRGIQFWGMELPTGTSGCPNSHGTSEENSVNLGSTMSTETAMMIETILIQCLLYCLGGTNIFLYCWFVFLMLKLNVLWPLLKIALQVDDDTTVRRMKVRMVTPKIYLKSCNTTFLWGQVHPGQGSLLKQVWPWGGLFQWKN